jgi:predicted nucleic acid-binding protein
MAAEEKIEGLVSTNSVSDIYYVARKHMSEEKAREALRNLFRVFSILTVLGEDCQSALNSQLSDYEDAILTACGRRSGTDFIISRDKDFLRSGEYIPILSPAAFLKAYSV